MAEPRPDAAATLLYGKTRLAEIVTDVLYERHPEWDARWGPGGRQYCHDDMLHNIQFLAGSLRSGVPEMFTNYVAWFAGILRDRGVPTDSLAESLDILGVAAQDRLDADDAAYTAALLEEGKAAIGRPAPVPGVGRHPLDERGRELLKSLVDGDGPGARSLMQDALAEGLTVPQMADELVQPAMAELGRMWQRNLVSVAQEHLATALILTCLAQIAIKRKGVTPQRRTALFACVEGNHHALGLRTVADAFESRGWRVYYLGADVPVRDLVRDVEKRRPDLLGLSVSLPHHVGPAHDAIAAVRARLGDRAPRVAVGGLLVNEYPGLGGVIGADLVFPNASLASAHEP